MLCLLLVASMSGLIPSIMFSVPVNQLPKKVTLEDIKHHLLPPNEKSSNRPHDYSGLLLLKIRKFKCKKIVN